MEISRTIVLLASAMMIVAISILAIEGKDYENSDPDIASEDTTRPGTRSELGELLWEYITDDWIFSSPAVGDLDRDGDLDLVFGNGVHDTRGSGGEVIALDNTGKALWEFSVDDDFPASTVIYDLFCDGSPEVLVGAENGGFYCLSGAEGTLIWDYDLDECESSAAVEDIDADGHPEILVCGRSVLVVLDRNGDVEWTGKGNYRCAPTIADLDDDGEPEVISCDMDTVYVYSGTGGLKWSTPAGWYVASSPGIGDVNEDGILDILVGAYTGGLYAISGNSGLLWKAETTEGVCDSSPAVYDLDGDGHLEAFVETEGGDASIYGISHLGEIEWVNELGNGYSSPAIADVNNDGIVELVAGDWWGGAFCLNKDGESELDFPKVRQMASSPVIADITGDGYLEVIMSSTMGNSDQGTVQCYSLNTTCGKGEIVWGSFQYDTCNTGNPLIGPVINTDLDGDGYLNGIDAFPRDPTQWKDSDGDGYGDNPDGNDPDIFPEDPDEWRDSDGDGRGNNGDAFPDDPDEWYDTDGDGVGDNSDAFPEDADEWQDTDGDGVGDNADPSPEDPTEWSDVDGDGVADSKDAFPEDPFESKDTDGDGVGDNADAFPEDPERWQDYDRDGVGDQDDRFPYDPGEWEDTDNDGTGDNHDAFPTDPSEQRDSDMDGTGDNADAFPYDEAASIDTDGDGYPDRWNEGMSRKDSSTGLALDEYPNDPDRYEKKSGFLLILVLLIVLVVVLVGLTLTLFLVMTRKGSGAVLKDD
ncbi:MAG: FG-GAP-like repeat-containing protein [Thermoplasmatota archaeon]